MTITASSSRNRCLVRPLPGGPDLTSAIAAVAARPSPAILESAAGDARAGRFSILACDPVEVVEIPADATGDPLAPLADRLGRGSGSPGHEELPFTGGWIGYLSYEAGLAAEGIVPRSPAATAFPWARFGLYDAAALYEHREHQWYLTAADFLETAGSRLPAPDRIERLADLLLHAEPVAPPMRGAAAGEPRPDWTWPEYAAKVAAAKEFIAAGHVYQVNLTQRFLARTSASPLELYLGLRSRNPADYAALLSGPYGAILSSSPELFLEVRDGRVRTRPIKGTRPRTGDAVLDAIRRDELAASPKDQAELNMIIDLLRNDLGKVCSIGSIRVESAGDIEAHPTVFHRVATISGRLGPKQSAVDLVRAAFPGGSVTGAPKIRAMQIINELETVQRGVYCGAIGYLGLDGNACFNVAIRTMMLEHGTVHLSAGGAITADSEAEDEYEELLAKAEGMFQTLRAVNEGSRKGAEAQRII